MFPIKHSWIFRSRWVALLWAAGMIWLAYDFAAPSGPPTNDADGNVQITDATGAPVSPEEANRLQDALKGL